MEAVLHIEPIMRHVRTPLSVGYTDYIFYGEHRAQDEDDVNRTTSSMRLGCPLDPIDAGSTRSHVPIVKTIEYTPDFSRESGNIYSETLHYFKDRKHLIPFRSKLRTGLGQGLRLTHLPSLNAVRESITGSKIHVCDPKSEIVTELAHHDQGYSKRYNPALSEWISDDLAMKLSKLTTSNVSFDTADLSRTIYQFNDQIHHTPNDLTPRHLRDLTAIVTPPIDLIPVAYLDNNYVSKHLLNFRDRLVPHTFDFRSFGQIPVDKFEKIDYNPFYFQSICEEIDKIPLTDFNVDIIVGSDGDIEFYHENIALDRFSVFSDNDSGLYSAETVFKEYPEPYFFSDILMKFINHHSHMNQEIEDTICYNAVKMKLIKTITEEAIILLYRHDSKPGDAPLCGVYFDIALQSLAPMSIIPEPVQI